MAQTVQSISHTSIEEPETEDNISLLFSVCDSLNELCITLEKMNHVLIMKNLAARIRTNYNGEKK